MKFGCPQICTSNIPIKMPEQRKDVNIYWSIHWIIKDLEMFDLAMQEVGLKVGLPICWEEKLINSKALKPRRI